jgi:NADPH:quinone reductase-like Zn-dependent oxidoreductase
MTDRFDTAAAERTMMAVVTTGNGGYDKLVYRAVPVPEPEPGWVRIRVAAAGVNNTEINTRLGWYSSKVSGGTADQSASQDAAETALDDGGWNEATPFPFIQGTDCCGYVDAVGAGGDAALIGRRVIVRACMRPNGFGSMENIWMASDFDGAFAQYVVVPETEAFPVDCAWTDAELATIPCAYGTAETMIHRCAVGPGHRVLVAGASGGVGSAAVQLAKRRGAHVIAVAGRDKHDAVKALGADQVVDRGGDTPDALGKESVDVVVDNVAGAGFGGRLELLKRGGRYVSSGAIAGPIVELDMRTMYLKDLTLIGSTAWDEPVFPDLIGYIERGEIRPLVAATYPLAEIADAQQAFLEKKHVGNFVLIPPQD